MRLDRLHIRSRFKNLADFQIDFDEASEMTVLVGRNGTGKSNLLEALTIIFRDLDFGLRPTFSYELCYLCRGHTITVDANPDRRSQLGYELTADGKHLTWRTFHDNSTREYLPNFVFGYYSGPSNRMEGHFERHQEAFYRQLLNNNDQPLRPLFFARPVHSQFVLLAFFLDTDPVVATFLREHLWIEAFDHALFIMREPPWTSRQGDPRFWNARGVVRSFLDRLYALALAPCRLKVRVPTDFKKQQSLEHLYLFLPDLEHVRALAGHYDTQQAFFKALESTYISKLISEVQISVRARKVGGSLTFRELSEGEQQLLMVLGLLRFTREDESLFLLDEPDTHLNPAWSVQYLKFLREIGGAQDNSHVIMATHDPLVISGLDRSQVQILQRDDDTGRIEVQQPESDPKYMGVPALLLSEVYGLRSMLPPATMALLDEKRRLAAKPELSEEERQALQRLDEKLEEADLLAENRDPMYRDFVLAYAQLQHERGLDKPVLSPEERAELHELAMSILRAQLPRGRYAVIHIPLLEIKAKIPDHWFATAAQALADVTMITDPPARAQAINNRDDVWKALREELAELRKDKCWYCESNDSRSDRPMDHYRPKNAIAECATHGGYWGLAFSWDNFRYCCTFCNSKRVDKEHGTTGGKHDHFPLWTDGIRATFGKCGPDELEREKPMLLDPCCETDPPLLWFDEDGKSMPHPHLCGAQGTFLYERVTTSITLYHLDHHKIVDRRQQLYQTIKRKLAQAEEKLRRLRDHADMTARHSLEEHVRELKEFMRPEQPYSATAKCAIMALRGSYTVADLVLHGA